MKKKVLSIKFNKPINLYCFTDVHIGAKEHDSVKFKKAIDTLMKDPSGYCFFNGDTLEFIPPNYGIPEGGQNLSTDEQIESLVKLLKKLGKKVLFFRSGNHESRALRLGGVELSKHISRETKIPMIGVGMEEVHVWIKKRKNRLVTTHGEGGNSKKILTNMQLTFPGADLYFSGHTHEMYINEGNMTISTSSGMEEFTNQIEMVGGSFLGWADYARSKNMRPTQTGCYVLEINENGVRAKGKIV
jgi:predicted MPP superfamily phosphohydrolase